MKSSRRAHLIVAIALASVVVPALAGCAGPADMAVDSSGWIPESSTGGSTMTIDGADNASLDETDYLDYEDDSYESDSDDWMESHLTCLSVMDGIAPRAAVSAVVDGDRVKFSSEEEAEEWIWDGFDTDPDALRVWAAAGTVDGRTFVWEDNGFSCDDAGKAERLSQSGSFVALYWNLDASTNFIFAKDGRLQTEFDPLVAPDTASWSVLESHGGEHVSDDDWWDRGSEQSALALQAKLMWLSGPADPSWLDDPSVEFWGYTY